MGLDMTLYEEEYISPYQDKDRYNELVEFTGVGTKTTDEKGSATVAMDVLHKARPVSITYEVARWRKANQVHNWFVENVQHGRDDCRRYHVSRQQLQELIDVCLEVLESKDDNDHSIVLELLPPSEGFFFGSQDIDEWYWLDLEETVTMLGRALSSTCCDFPDFYYTSSW